ncbi:MAG TPA: M48 family peptidase, partial [Flavobacteriales bacterium]|nr:M48 family peptidase [Flavobacteriales bacterium]
MNILKSKVAIVLLGFVMLEACAKVPITGRRQLNLVSEGEMMAMANTQYAGFLGENQPLPAANDNVVRVRTIGEKLAAAATKFLTDNNAANRIEGFDWQFNVVDDPTVNAWCMPGGKVVVYTGILPVTQN